MARSDSTTARENARSPLPPHEGHQRHLVTSPIAVEFPDGGAAYRFTTAAGKAGEWLRPPAGVVKLEIRAALPVKAPPPRIWPRANAAEPEQNRRRRWWSILP